MARQGSAGRQRQGRGPNMFVVTLLVLAGTALGGSAVLFGPQLVEDLLSGSDTIRSEVAEPGSLAEGPAQAALDDFVAALEAADLSGVVFAAAAPGEAVSEFEEVAGGLGAFSLAAEAGEPIMVSAAGAQAPIELTWTFPNEAVWTTTSQVVLEAVAGQWRVRWDPAILEPSLNPGDVLRAEQLAGPRGSILGRGGAVLVGQTDLVRIGVRPDRVQDLASLTETLQAVLGIDGADLAARVQGAQPDAFVDVATLPRAEYDLVRDQVFPLPGTVFRESSQPQAVDADFARALLGRSGEVTAEIIEANPGLFEPGDVVGLSGLQALYNGVLGGRPGLEITVRRAAPVPTATTAGTGLTTTSAIRDPSEPEPLFAIDAEPGQQVVTTIDPRAQRAAEAALERTPLTSALVAIEVSTGHVVAVANGPRGSSVNYAMAGQYPPGSIFKVVSGYAVVRDVLGPEDPINCPVRVEVGGRTFGNAEDEVLGQVSFRSAFAHSCNTAFVNATLGFGPTVLSETAAQFGLGVGYDLGVDGYGGSVPVADSNVDLAAAAFGQGRLLVSPLSSAVMAATAAGGTYRSPLLVTSPAPAPQIVEPLDPRAAAITQELMRAVVTEGTGRAVANVAGGPVSGKTGTAEFGNEVPPRSHAWFVGYQGDLAFAVFVEAGEFGGATAAPIAAQFLDTLASGG